MLRALLNMIGLGRAVAPAVEQSTSTNVEVEAPKPSDQQPRRGRPRTYDPDRAATGAERMRRQRWVKGRNTRHQRDENYFRHANENPPRPPLLKEEEKKERAMPISRDFKPDVDSERECRAMIGDHYETDLADHIDYCLKTDFRCHDHNAAFRRRCRALQRNPQLRLDLRPRGPQLGVVGKSKRREAYDSIGAAINRMQACAEESKRARGEDAPHSPEDKAAVKASYERFRKGGALG
jgi:hypothetical protein